MFQDQTNYPNNPEAESKLLAACVLEENSDFYDSICSTISADDFYNYKNKLIYKAIANLCTEGIPLTPEAMVEDLKKSSSFEDVELADVARIFSDCCTHLAGQQSAKIVKEKSQSRSLIRILRTALEDASEETKSAEELRSRVESQMCSIESTSRQEIGIEGTVDALKDEFEAQLRGEYQEDVIKTHIGQLDEQFGCGGIAAGEVCVISAPTSCGKSQLALNIALKSAMRDGHGIGLFSLEMPQKQVMKRIITTKSQTNLRMIKDQMITEDRMQIVRESCDKVKDLPFYTVHSIRDIDELCSHARTMVRRHKVRLLIIDYLQLIPWPNKSMSKNDAVADISHRIKQLALELNVSVLLLSQVNREGARREGGLAIYDLKDSGDIENDADIILLLWPEYDDVDASRFADGARSYISMMYNIAKNREGQRDVRGKLRFYAQQGIFT